jgi:hypothetical protein
MNGEPLDPEPPPESDGSVPIEPRPIIPLKAPWEKGECYRAGGAKRFGESFTPFGFYIFWDDDFSDCGYGPGGLYYGQSPTHLDKYYFAIDFTRYRKGFPYIDAAEGQLVLAAHDGCVTSVRSNLSTFEYSGDQGAGNFVEIDSNTPGWPVGKYRTRYLHLDGPNTVFVSKGMWVRQGARLGFVDSTGNSAMPHLHFELQDRDLNYATLPLSPLDGQQLPDDNEGGQCVCSTNVPFPQ